MSSSLRRVLVIPRIQIHNANALSSPFTVGFPAMTAWLGASHALQRHLNQAGYQQLAFLATGIVCHHFDLQTYTHDGDFISSIIGTSNPLDKEGFRPAFIEEARCHLQVSLLIEVANVVSLEESDVVAQLLNHVQQILHSKMKMAGGDILSFQPPYFQNITEDSDLQKLTRRLMPGYTLIERRDLMLQSMADGLDGMDALLEHLAIHHTCSQQNQADSQHEDDIDLDNIAPDNIEPESSDVESRDPEIKGAKNKVTWVSKRKNSGWIVPIATGFQGLTPLATAKNQRDADKPHRFAESVVTLGEFKMLYRIKQLDDLLWQSTADLATDLYLCQPLSRINDSQNKPSNTLDDLFFKGASS